MQPIYGLLLSACLFGADDRKLPPPPKPEDDPAKSVIDELLKKEPARKTESKSGEDDKNSSATSKQSSKEMNAKKATDASTKSESPEESTKRQPPPPPKPAPSDPVGSGVKPTKYKAKRPTVADSKTKKQSRDEIVDELLNKANAKGDSKTAAPPMLQKPTDQVVDGLVEKGEKSKEAQGLEFFAKAKEAEKAGDLKLALSMAQRARDLMPTNREVRGYAIALGQELSLLTQANANTTKAKAHLALAYSRSTELWNAGRYSEAADLLDGIVRSAVLFPKSADVTGLQKQAESQLEACKQKLNNPIKTRAEDGRTKIVSTPPKPPTPSDGSDSDGVKVRLTPEVMSPENAKRLLRINDADVPTWYATQKLKLAATMNVNYANDRLTSVLDEISRTTGVQFVIDGPVGNSGAHTATLIDMRISGVAAESILDLACQRCGLEYVLMEKGIVITTPTKATEFIRQLPDALRNNWAAARVLFPDIHTDLLSSPPSIASERRAAEDRNVPAFLVSGKALQKHIQSLLK